MNMEATLERQEITRNNEFMTDAQRVPTPIELQELHPLTEVAQQRISDNRQVVEAIMSGRDNRKLIIVGPCSLDDAMLDNEPAVVRLAETLAQFAQQPHVQDQAMVVMRCPPVKPRSANGWAGLEQTNLIGAHGLLSHIANKELPLAIEVMHERHFARFGHLLTTAWVGAREVNSTLLRHSVSAQGELPIWFKNGQDGKLDDVTAAIQTAQEPHDVEFMDETGQLWQKVSKGHSNTGFILRGGAQVTDPNDFAQSVMHAEQLQRPFLVDCAHGNAVAHDENQQKSVAGQLACLEHLKQILTQQTDMTHWKGLMLEAHVHEGSDPVKAGFSRTDPCIGIDRAIEKLEQFLKNTLQ